MANERMLRIYLNDHLTTAAVAASLARRARRSGQPAELGTFLERLATDLDDDAASVERTMRERGLKPSAVKRTLGVAAERVGRLKLNGHLRTESPLSRLVELEGLTLLVSHNASLWRSLETLGIERAAGLAERAEGHLGPLAEHRRAAATRALGDGEVE